MNYHKTRGMIISRNGGNEMSCDTQKSKEFTDEDYKNLMKRLKTKKMISYGKKGKRKRVEVKK